MEAQVMAFTMCQFNKSLKVTRKQVANQFLAIYSLKKAIQKYRKKGYDVALKEMRQLKERRCFIPISKDELKAMECWKYWRKLSSIAVLNRCTL
jgi:hypothetical protein